ncbi:MAG: hypothetical protein IKB61_03560 [Elusimicrobiaceae bacterium]|nr:hypothetical protein [Elusimicrobiaceae bacterium]
MNIRTEHNINFHLKKARKKHPDFAKNNAEIVAIAAEEFGEWAKEINENNLDNANEEALDLIAVLIRFLEDD